MDTSLVAVFLAESAAPADAPDLDARLGAVVAAAREAHPRLGLEAARFVRHLARRRPGDASSGEWLASVHAGDLYLACACAEGVPGAIEALDRLYLSRVGTYLASMRPTASFVEDVAQSLRERLLVSADGGPPRIAEYSGRGALGGWLRVAAVRLALDVRRKRTEDLAERGVEEPAALQDPEGVLLKRRHAADLNAAFREAVGALPADQRRLLRMHFVEGATLDELAAASKVHRATVARWLAAARQEILAGARRRLGDRLKLPPAELESLMGVMRSQLDISLSSAFPEAS